MLVTSGVDRLPSAPPAQKLPGTPVITTARLRVAPSSASTISSAISGS